MLFATELKNRRKGLGLTQQQTANLANLSLATLQNIENGSANPSIEKLTSLLKALGLRLSFEPEPLDWNVLIALGLPLNPIGSSKPATPLTAENLNFQLNQATPEVFSEKPLVTSDSLRKRECLESMLLAIYEHFPSYFLKRLKHLEPLLPKKVTGRHIKLRKIALAKISTYL